MDKQRRRFIPAAQHANKERANANFELRLQAYNMLIQGYTHEQIGRELGRSAPTIRRWVDKYRKKLEQDTLEQHRSNELARLDKQQRLTDGLVTKALQMAEEAAAVPAPRESTETDPYLKGLEVGREEARAGARGTELAIKAANLALKAQAQMLQVSESRRRLLGLNAAERATINDIENKTPAEKDLDDMLRKAQARVHEQEQRLKEKLDEALGGTDE